MFAVIDLLAQFFYDVFGNPLIITLVVMVVLIGLMMALKANLAVMLVTIIPVAVGFVLNEAGSNFIEFPAWVLLTFFIIAGFVFAMIFLYFVR